MRIHLIHGIHATRPGGNTSRLKPYFEAAGFAVVVHSYGWLPALLARFRNAAIAETIAGRIEDGDICVGHSNGATIIQIIQERHRTLAGAVLVNPALDRDAHLGHCGWVDVYYNGCDCVVGLARLLVADRWGDLGRVGYQGNDPRFRNIDCRNTPGMPPVCGHTALFDQARLTAWGPQIARNVARRIQSTEGAR